MNIDDTLKQVEQERDALKIALAGALKMAGEFQEKSIQYHQYSAYCRSCALSGERNCQTFTEFSEYMALVAHGDAA